MPNSSKVLLHLHNLNFNVVFALGRVARLHGAPHLREALPLPRGAARAAGEVRAERPARRRHVPQVLPVDGAAPLPHPRARTPAGLILFPEVFCTSVILFCVIILICVVFSFAVPTESRPGLLPPPGSLRRD